MLNQKLIDELWKHTDRIDEENIKKTHNELSQKELKIISSKTPQLLPASFFFKNAASSLFMSFHHEGANSMRHYHDFFELIYVCKGNPIGIINDHEIHLEEGNLCIMNPNAVHYFKKYAENTDLILNIVLPKDLFQKSIFRILFNDPVLNAFFIRYRIENEKHPSFFYLKHLDVNIDNFIEILLKEYLNKKEYSYVIIESLLTLIFSFIIRNYKEQFKGGNSIIADIINYIYLNYQSVTMESVAAYFNYHPKYLSSLIHKHTGQCFRNLIVNIKLQNSINYLLYTDYSIEQIVELIGYKDKSSFYSLFKKEYGLSPAAYRKQFA
ncbi:AraC family transcriptional regulator [Clostridium sp. SYSU_GA19001]|uniref:helix-turn-helix domain-containing protein n=1 Tax=Clostridium caldaquaticum TaxID=2940653 RepID=UPI0020771D63|nr:helix-turn-helix domain-containing protein [Clostridium caldaquaticum]MCM8711070.1 AraC family transcriptional regulator [Clostridium caldaquaticum]